MQSQGTLSETSLRNLLETAQGERATGILTIRDGDRSATLYLLFGSLVHAEAGGQVGDDAVVDALGWPEGEFSFDSKAKLPADETVNGTLADLISAADAAARNGSPPADAFSESEPAADAGDSEEAGAEADKEPEPDLEPEPIQEAPTLPPAARSAAADAPQVPMPRRGVKHRPEPKTGREPIPVPAGEVTYDSLKTSFVDFPRLITTLERDGYTGYVRLLTDEASGLIFFKDGRALECVYDAGELLLGRQALRDFSDQVTRGLGVLDVVGLSPEVVDGLHELTVARPLYTELYASWVDFPSLLEFLSDRGHTGSVTVRSSGKTGVIIFTQGTVTGAYTSASRDISDQVDEVRALCDDAKAMIEVKAAEPASHAPLDVDDVVDRRTYGGGFSAPAPAPVAPPPAEASFEPEPEPEPEPDVASTIPPAPARTIEPTPAAGDTIPPAPAATSTTSKEVDWERVLNDLQQLAEESLGNRSRKVKDILAGAEHSQAGVERAIDEIPTISLLFVDSSRLEALAQDMRTRLQSEL